MNNYCYYATIMKRIVRNIISDENIVMCVDFVLAIKCFLLIAKSYTQTYIYINKV